MNSSPHFVKVILGGVAYKLRMTPEYRWRILTLENPDWATDFEKRGLLCAACQVWAMLDPDEKKIPFKGPKDILALINDSNALDVVQAVNTLFDLAKPQDDADPKESGSTPSPSPALS